MITATATATATIQSSFAFRDQLVLENMDLVKSISLQVRRGLAAHVELDDLMNAGMMGLIDAASKYEQGKEVPFNVYAKHRVRGAVLDSLRQIDSVSREARRQYKQVDAVTRDLTAKLQRTPTQEEVAQAMGVDSRRWQTMMREYRTTAQASAQASGANSSSNNNGDEGPLREVPASPEASPERIFARRELRTQISSALGALPERHRQVVTLYYEGDMTMKQIGNMLGVNESRVSQIHKTALAKIQVILTSNGIRETAAVC